MMAIKEFNAKGGVLGRRSRRSTWTPRRRRRRASRIAERMITRNEAAFLVGALHSGVANAISQVAQKYGCIYLNTNSSSPDRGRQGLPPRQVRLGRQRHQLLATRSSRTRSRQRQELGAAHQRLRVGTQHVEGDARDRRGERRQDHRRADGAAEHARLLLVPAQDPADQARRGRRGDRRRRHQGAAPAGRAAQADTSAGVDQQPAGLARRLRPRPGRDLRRVRHQLVLPPRPARREGIRRRLPEAVPGHGDQGAGQRLLQRLHGDARAAALRRGSRHDQQHHGDQGARRPQDDRARPACSTTTRGSTRPRTSAADDLHGHATTTSRPRRTTSSRSSPRCRRRTSMDKDAPTACKLETYEATPSYEM